MGGLHKGHMSLIKKSQNFKGKTLVSIFVNPKQFNEKKDFLNYPRNLKKDLKILKHLNVDLIYLPNLKDIFSFQVKNKIFLDKFSKKLCGAAAWPGEARAPSGLAGLPACPSACLAVCSAACLAACLRACLSFPRPGWVRVHCRRAGRGPRTYLWGARAPPGRPQGAAPGRDSP